MLQHEAFHQFAYFAIDKELSDWVNEGLAQMFQEGIWTGKEFWMGEIPPQRVRELRADMGENRLVELRRFAGLPHEEWVKSLGSKDQHDRTYYNEAWALMEFFNSGGHREYAEGIKTYLKKLHDGEEQEKAFGAAFPRAETMQAEFSSWLVNVRPTPGATAVERLRVLGDFLLGAKAKGWKFKFKDMAEFKQAVVSQHLQLTTGIGRFLWKTSDHPEEYFQDVNGRDYEARALYFDPEGKGLGRDIVCRVGGGTVLRAHFYTALGDMGVEVVVDAAGR